MSDSNIIITQEDTLTMLDALFEKRDGDWWDGFYQDHNRPVPFFGDYPDEHLVELAASGQLIGKRALDIGCGNGRNTLYLADNGCDAIGLDISEEALRWAEDLSRQHSRTPTFYCQSFFDYQWKRPFDVINDSGCFHHIKPHRREGYLSKIRDALAPDGLFTMTCFNTQGGADLSDYDVYRDFSMHGGLGFSEEKLRCILGYYFDIIDLRPMKEVDDTAVFGKSFLWVVRMRQK